MTNRAFSPKCIKCRQRTMTLTPMPYSVQIEHDGRKYTVDIPALVVPKCSNCEAIAFDEETNKKIDEAFRHKAGLLTPEQIRTNREALGLTQKQLAAHLEVGEATLSRWETGAQIQQRCLDRFVRVFFEVPEVRKHLGYVPRIGHAAAGAVATA